MTAACASPNGITRRSEKPAFAIHPLQSAAAYSEPFAVSINMLRLESSPAGSARERWSDLRQVKTTAAQMRVGARNLDRHAALRRPDVKKGSIARPWKLRRQ